ncbi:MAG: HAD family hydrolase, partial [Myxococcota bacterium]|nr:HAD family hydrolase [Myxococcota bacterium]
WPVEGVVGENGAFYFQYQHSFRKMIRHFFNDEDQRLHDRERLKIIEDQVLLKVPGAALSADQAYRETDLAIDFCEDIPPLSVEAVENIVEIFESHGAKAKVSSIHVNGWFGDYDKLSMTRLFTRERWGLDLDEHREEFLFCGDSLNDEPMFAWFPYACGVANVHDFKDAMTSLPKFVTSGRGGEGFCQLADRLLELRAD